MLVAKLLGARIPLPRLALAAVGRHCFSSEDTTIPSFMDRSRAKTFYRKTIQNVNIKKANDRGIFTEQVLQRLIKLAKPEDITLMFEAYYNYVGHFTIFSNKVTDSFVLKMVALAQEDPTKVGLVAEKVLQLLDHHEYLRYYPHYKVTKTCAEFIAKHSYEHYPEFLRIVSSKIFIKLDKDTLDQMFSLCQQWKDFNHLMKIAVFRFNHNLLPDVSKQDILTTISHKLKTDDAVYMTRISQQFETFLQKFDQPSLDLALVQLITQGRLNRAARIFSQLPSDDQNAHVFSQTVLKIEENSEKDKDLRGRLESLLEDSPHVELFR